MQTMNISLPDPMKAYVEEQVQAGAYSSVSEFIRELVRADQRRHAKNLLENTLVAAMNEGDAVEATDEWWATLRKDVNERTRGRQAKRVA